MPSIEATLSSAAKLAGMMTNNDRIIDKPALTVHFVAETIEELKSIVSYMNDVFNITAKSGQSMLMERFNSENIVY